MYVNVQYNKPAEQRKPRNIHMKQELRFILYRVNSPDALSLSFQNSDTGSWFGGWPNCQHTAWSSSSRTSLLLSSELFKLQAFKISRPMSSDHDIWYAHALSKEIGDVQIVFIPQLGPIRSRSETVTSSVCIERRSSSERCVKESGDMNAGNMLGICGAMVRVQPVSYLCCLIRLG